MRGLMLLLALLAAGTSCASAATRIKDITSVREMRLNQLIGYGLVAGLKGTGDSLRNAPFTEQSVNAMLEHLGVNVRGLGARTRNVAAVLVTAELPAFAMPGKRIDITVTSLGDASSITGGTLVRTPLLGADNRVYAVAQGSITTSGFEAKGKNEALTQGVPTVGRIPGGAIVERASPSPHVDSRTLHLDLNNPDFATAIAIVDAINAYGDRTRKTRIARDDGPASVGITIPPGMSASRFLAEIGRLEVRPDAPARIVIDERTGTVVISRNVKVSRVAVTHGNLSVSVTETPVISQPAPLSNGETVVTSETTVAAGQKDGNFAVVEGADLQTLVNGLNRMGLKPPGIIAILEAIKSAGALQAELIVQ